MFPYFDLLNMAVSFQSSCAYVLVYRNWAVCTLPLARSEGDFCPEHSQPTWHGVLTIKYVVANTPLSEQRRSSFLIAA